MVDLAALRVSVADHPPVYEGRRDARHYDAAPLDGFNHRHAATLGSYGLRLAECTVWTLDDHVNGRSHLGAFANRRLRESAILAAALPAVAVALHGFGAYAALRESERTKKTKDALKRANDRTAAQVMSEVLQTTTESLELGEEVVIESAITEGTRAKPGLEVGGNPTIAVGALFGKPEHRAGYGRKIHPHVRMLTMGNDVIDGTTKSVTGANSSFTALFLTESGAKRHLPDIYVQRWMAGVRFAEFDPREVSIAESARLVAEAYGLKDVTDLSAYFLLRPRHELPIRVLNEMGVSTPTDKDGDLFPALMLGAEGVRFPDGRGLLSMLGEIGGSAEWAVGALPLVWRGGQALGMLTSQSSLTRSDLSPDELWKERFHYTEDEGIDIQDARFEQKPWFTIDDIMEKPFAGGVSAFGAISDNDFYPPLKGVTVRGGSISAHVLAIDSLGVMRHWEMTFTCVDGLESTRERMRTPKDRLEVCGKNGRPALLGRLLADERERERLRICVGNEFYPGFIRNAGQWVALDRTFAALVERGALRERDLRILEAVKTAAPEWFAGT